MKKLFYIFISISILLLLISRIDFNNATFRYKNKRFLIFNNQFKNTKLDNIFIINLDRSSERYKFMYEQLKGKGFDFKRFSAVDGKKLSFIDLTNNDHYLIDNLLSIKDKLSFGKYLIRCRDNSNIIIRQLMLPGEYGCFCSHYLIWQQIAEQNLGNVLILEDDTNLVPDFTKKISKALKKAPKNWDIIYLYALFDNKSKYRNIANLDFIRIGNNTGMIAATNSYIISSKTAKILLKKIEYIYKPIDLQLSDIINEQKLNTYLINQNLVSLNETLATKSFIHD